MKRLIGCFLDPEYLCHGHLRCARARQGNWACSECGHALLDDGLCDRCDAVEGVVLDEFLEALRLHGCNPEPRPPTKVLRL